MRGSLWLSLCLAVLGCDPVASVHGRVVRAPATAPEGAANEDGAPIPDARVSMTCPGREGPIESRRTDAQGRVGSSFVGFWARDCSLVVGADGYKDEIFPLKELCPAGEEDCQSVAFQAELSPGASASPSAPQVPAVGGAPAVLVHLTANRGNVRVLKLVGELGTRRPWDWKAWEPVCQPPCDARLSNDDRLGLSIGDREPIELLEKPRLVPDARVRVGYDDRRPQRNVARVLFVAGVAATTVGSRTRSWTLLNTKSTALVVNLQPPRTRRQNAAARQEHATWRIEAQRLKSAT